MDKSLFDRITLKLEQVGLKAATASRLAGLSDDAIRNIRRTGGANARTLEALAGPLQTNVGWLLGETDHDGPVAASDDRTDATRILRLPDIPVVGTAAASLGDGAFMLDTNPVDYITRPATLANAVNAYGIYVANNSMHPAHPDGALRIVHPGRPVLPGDTVIIQVQTGARAPSQAYITTFLRRTPDWVHCVQSNPVAKIDFRTGTVLAIHKVLTTNEIFGK